MTKFKRQTAIASGGVSPVVGAPSASGSRLIRSFSSLPGLKYGTFFGGTSTLSPVFGLRPLRGSRWRRRKLPNPRSSIFSPRCRASMMLLKTVSTISSECFLVRSETRETSSTSSAFVMVPSSEIENSRSSRTRESLLELSSSRFSNFLPLIPNMFAQRCLAGAGRFLVRLPVRTEFVGLERANTQADLPLGGAQLDDLHLVRFADLQI